MPTVVAFAEITILGARVADPGSGTPGFPFTTSSKTSRFACVRSWK